MKFYFVVEGNIFLKIWSVFSQIIYIIFRESDFIIKTHISMGVLVSKRLIINSTPWYQRRGISSNLSRPSSLVQESFLTTIKMLKRICCTRRACFRSVEFFLSAVSTGDNNLSNVVPIFRGKLYTRAVRAHWRKFSTLFVLRYLRMKRNFDYCLIEASFPGTKDTSFSPLFGFFPLLVGKEEILWRRR